MEIRRASSDDPAKIIEIRRKRTIDEKYDPCADMDDSLWDFFGEKFENNTIVEFSGFEEGEVIAASALISMRCPPSFRLPAGIRGYITNVCAAPAYRRCGIAAKMLKQAAGEAKNCRIGKLILMASDHGKPVCQRFGFKESEAWMDN